jgi:hypothetical protein
MEENRKEKEKYEYFWWIRYNCSLKHTTFQCNRGVNNHAVKEPLNSLLLLNATLVILTLKLKTLETERYSGRSFFHRPQ